VTGIVEEVTDTNWLQKGTRKRLQVSRARRSSSAAKLVKLADKNCNLQDILASPPAGWSVERQREYFDWAKSVIDRVRGANPRLEKRFDPLYGMRP
jgi:guanosine-3',5'-bis(diphosphate) 3'-pyrophosphohydrolase